MKKLIYLALFLSLMFSACRNSNNKQAEKELPNDTLKTDILLSDSQIISQYKILYEELLGFKTNTDFKEKGFAPSGPYTDWHEKVLKLTKQEKNEFVLKHGIGASDLLNLGMEYVRTKGADNDNTESYKRHFEFLFNPQNINDGQPIDNGIDMNGESIGKWHVKNTAFPNDDGFTIEIQKRENSYVSIEAGEIKKLKKSGEKYYVIGDVDNTYYIIKNGNLRFCSIDGDYTDQAGWVISPVKR